MTKVKTSEATRAQLVEYLGQKIPLSEEMRQLLLTPQEDLETEQRCLTQAREMAGDSSGFIELNS